MIDYMTKPVNYSYWLLRKEGIAPSFVRALFCSYYITDEPAYLQCCWRISLWVGTGLFLALSRCFSPACSRLKSVPSRSEDVDSNWRQRPNSCCNCHSDPDILVLTALRCTESRQLNSDSRAPPTQDCNIQTLHRQQTQTLTTDVAYVVCQHQVCLRNTRERVFHFHSPGVVTCRFFGVFCYFLIIRT